ncbi:hypothetical protein [Streptosporangium sp. CA-115845]|uniref:hypothetical protein n=1 Tax=Streptosporangium sp. CA-115845 TaxID=3240071 RepID=UPI003D8BF6EF
MASRNTNTDQRVAPKPEFGQMTEGQRRFVQTAVTARDTFYGRSRTHTARANQVGARLDEKSRQLEALRQEIAQLLAEKTEDERLASVNWDDYQAHEDALKQLGAQVPPPQDPQAYPLNGSQGSIHEHADAFGSPIDQPADGFCNYCGKPVWKHPDGSLRHAFNGVMCNPEDPNSTNAMISPSGSEAVA